MALVQLTTLRGELPRQPYVRGETPIVELHLEDNQRVVQLDLADQSWREIERKTHDWIWHAVIETRL